MVLESSWAVLGRLVGVLGLLVGILDRLVGVLGWLGDFSVLLVDVLRRLVAVLGRLGDLRVCRSCQHLCPVAGAQGPPIRILFDFPDHYKDI